MKPIQMKLVRSRFLTRWPCHICNGETEKDSILCEAKTPNGTLRCRPRCLSAGNIDERLTQSAMQLEQQAQLIRDLIGRVRVPTFKQWATAECDGDAAEIEAIEAAWAEV